MWCPAAWDDLVNLEASTLQGRATYLSRTDIFGAAQAEDFVEGESKSCSTEARCSAVVDGPHERQRPGSNELHEEDPSYQRQAVRHTGLSALGILQQGPHQERLGTEGEKGYKVGERVNEKHAEKVTNNKCEQRADKNQEH